MTLGIPSNDRYRERTDKLVPAASTARVRCAACNRISSIGQYPAGSNVCIKCKPMPAGWRRGEL